MNKLSYTLIFFFYSATSLFGQHFPLLSNYELNDLFLNPATTGSKEALNISTVYRNQWMGVDGTPKSYMLMLNTPSINLKNGFGIVLMNDEIGIQKSSGLYGSYAYRIKCSKNAWISAGMASGVSIINQNTKKIKTNTAFDPVLERNETNVLFDISAGILYKSNRLNMGLSLPLLYTHKYSQRSKKYSIYNQFNEYQWIFTSSYLGEIDNELELKPTLLVIYQNTASKIIEAGCQAVFVKKYSFGLKYRLKEAVIIILTFQIKEQLDFSYAYDYAVSSLKSNYQGTHEIGLSYKLLRKVNTKNARTIYRN